MSKWLSSSFPEATNDKIAPKTFSTQPTKQMCKKGSLSTRPSAGILHPKDPDSILWVERYSPINRSELAVSRKKMVELENWFQTTLQSKQPSAMLLLTGPPGAGKTAAVMVLAREMGLEVKEWINEPVAVWQRDSELGFESHRDYTQYSSQTEQFQNFLLRANKYPSLLLQTRRRIILVEEFPNAFMKDASVFHSILRKFSVVGRCPLIFILTDVATTAQSEFHLFPKNLVSDLNISHISFRSITTTALSRVLNRICEENSITLPKEKLENMVSACGGDVRSCINSLDFSYHEKLPVMEGAAPPAKKKRKNACHQVQSILVKDPNACNVGGRDASLFLFHALGKVLYSKRCGSQSSEPSLPPHLQHLAKDPLKETPEEVFEKAAVTADSFILFLHQNYPKFISDISMASSCCAWLSEADTVCTEWAGRSTMEEFLTSMATRGLMFSIVPESGSRGWKTIQKPRWYDVNKRIKENCCNMKELFKGWNASLADLPTDILPFLSLMRTSMLNTGQQQLLQQVARLHRQEDFYINECESLQATEAFMDNTETVASCSVRSVEDPVSVIPEEEELLTIEEYDD